MMLIYPIAYAIVWTLPTSIRIYQTVSDHRAPWQLQTVDKACIVLQGFVDAVIYGVNETSLSSWRQLLFPEAFPILSASGNGNDGSSSSKADTSKPTKTDMRMSGGGLWALPSSSKINQETSVTMASGSDSSHSLDLGPDKSGFGDAGAYGNTALEMGRIRKTVEVEIRTSIHAGESDTDDLTIGRTFYRY
jgi:hypothetical protein